MKVNIINFHHVLNYGAVFQGYALCKFLNNSGHEAKIIDYRPWYFLSRTYRPAKGIKMSYKKFLMNRSFLNFRKKHFLLTKKVFYTPDQLLYHYIKSSEAFICGSDQIWNAKITNGKLDPGYFLEFVPKTGRKIAYAASIGHTTFNRNDKQKIADNLLSYHSISVREDFAKKEVYEITDHKIDPLMVLDPTLILDDYSEVLDFALVPQEPYMVVYTTEDSEIFREYSKRVAKALNIKVLNLGHYKTGVDSVDYTNIHPSQWLGIFSRANYVCTNSFHGTAFSIVFHRNFTVLGRSTMKDLNRRQLTLLSQLGIEHRFIHNLEDFDVKAHLEEIDFDDVERKLEIKRNSSRKYLLDCLKQ